jgi:hypothetical protein
MLRRAGVQTSLTQLFSIFKRLKIGSNSTFIFVEKDLEKNPKCLVADDPA